MSTAQEQYKAWKQAQERGSTAREQYEAWKRAQQQGLTIGGARFLDIPQVAPIPPALSTSVDIVPQVERAKVELTARERFLEAKRLGLIGGQRQVSSPAPLGQAPPISPPSDVAMGPPLPKHVLREKLGPTFGHEFRDLFPVTEDAPPQEQFERVASGLYSGITTGGLVGREEFEGKPGYEAGVLLGTLTPEGTIAKTGDWMLKRLIGWKPFRSMVTRAGKFIGDKVVPDFLKQAKNRFKLPESKKLLDEILAADNLEARFAGTSAEGARTAGLYGLSEKEGIALADAIESGSAPEYKHIFHNLWRLARGAGLKIGKIENYFPRYFKREVGEALYNDFAQLRKLFGENFNGSDEAIVAALGKANKITRDAIAQMVEGGMRYDVALQQLSKQFKGQLYLEAGFEHARTLNVPAWMYERDARIVIPRYIKQVSKRVAEARTWGPTLGSAERLIGEIAQVDAKEAELAGQILKMWTGKYEIEEGLTGTAKTLADRWTNFQFATKIGAGTATAPNVTQSLISTIPKGGAYNFVRGGLGLMDKANRSFVRKGGPLNKDMLHSIMGDTPDMAWRGFADAIAEASGFSGVNRVNQYLAASTIKESVLDWQRIARAGGKDAEWAIEKIKSLGNKWSKNKRFWEDAIPEHKMKEIMYRFATDTQLQKNILNDPLMFNNPKTRWLFLFKRFGYRQFAYIKDEMKRELLQGDARPLLRLAAGGYFGGEFVVWAKNNIKEGLSGQPYFRKDKPGSLDRFLNNIAAIGSFGVMSDLMDVEDMTDLVNTGEFLTSPVVASDARDLGEAVKYISNDWDTYHDVGLVTRRNAHRLPGFFGSLPRAAAQRLKTGAQRRNQISYARRDIAKQIRQIIKDGDLEEAYRLIDVWNEQYPEHPITGKHVGGGAIAAEERRRQEAISDAKR